MQALNVEPAEVSVEVSAAAGALRGHDSLASASTPPHLFSRTHLLDKRYPTPSRWAGSSSRRCIDFALALVGLSVAAPVLALAAVSIRLTSRGPALFCQQRSGRAGTTFTIYKLRTMVHDADRIGPSVTSKDDARTTSLGRWLRRYKLDELPQLFNVLRGDMSFVGPRPKLVRHDTTRMLCRPGITGAASLIFNHEEDLLNDIPAALIEDYTVNVLNPIKARLDAQYAQRCSPLTDAQIVLATIFRIGTVNSALDLADVLENDASEA